MSDDGFPSLQPRRIRDPKRIGPWKVGRTIGKGAQGRVRLARHAQTGQMAAIKILTKSVATSRRESLDEAAQDAKAHDQGIQREMVLMKLIDHPNILRLYDVWETPTEVYLVLEYVQGGELFEFLMDHGPFPPHEALFYFKQIIAALEYCHRFNIIHRDLKPENILLDQNGNIKVADFGLAAWQSSNALLETACGSPHYAAPEVLSGKAYNGSSADIWSCGIVLYALLTQILPFDHHSQFQLCKKIQDEPVKIPEELPLDCQDLLRSLLTKDASRRLTLEGIKRHPFFRRATPKLADHQTPTLDEIARPIATRADIDEELFTNLAVIWRGDREEDLMDALTSPTKNWHKGAYYLLAQYRERTREVCDEQAELARNARFHQKRLEMARRRAMMEQGSSELAQDGCRNDLDLPPRAGPPTPRRARGNLCINVSQESLTPRPKRIQLQDEPALAPSHLLPPLSAVRSSDSAIIQEILHLSHLKPATLDRFTNTRSESQSTKPLTIRRKERKVDRRNKENLDAEDGDYLVIDAPEPGEIDMFAHPSLRSRRILDSLRDQQNFAPMRRRSKLKKRQVSSPVSPLPSEVSSSPAPFSPVVTWFAGVFKFKPLLSLSSVRDLQTTRTECRRLLMGMGVLVKIEDEGGLGVLRCELKKTNDLGGAISVLKGVQFRIEVHSGAPETMYELNMVHEKGSMESFKEICKRLSREWSEEGFGVC